MHQRQLLPGTQVGLEVHEPQSVKVLQRGDPSGREGVCCAAASVAKRMKAVLLGQNVLAGVRTGYFDGQGKYFLSSTGDCDERVLKRRRCCARAYRMRRRDKPLVTLCDVFAFFA